MVKIFVVTSGTYSDYRIDGVFSTRGNAEAAIEAKLGERIEGFELDEPINSKKRGYRYYYIRFADTNVGDIDEIKVVDTIGTEYINQPQGGNLFIYLWAKDTNHAVKIANEKRVQWLSERLPNR